MAKLSFPFRFIIDSHFFNKVMKIHPELFTALMYISSSSKKFKRRHNLMSEKVRDKIIEENPNYGPEYIKSSLNKVNEPQEIEKIQDEIIRNIKYAIYYSTNESEDEITNICILTSDDKKGEYIKNPHFQGIKHVSVRSGKVAVDLLMDFKEKCWSN